MNLIKFSSRYCVIFSFLFIFLSCATCQHEPAVFREVLHNSNSTSENKTESVIPVAASGALRDMTFTSAKAKTDNTAENATANFNKGNRIESYSSGVPNIAPTNSSSPLTAQEKLKSSDLHQAKVSEINAASLRPLLAPVQQASPQSDVSAATSGPLPDTLSQVTVSEKNDTVRNANEHTNITTLINS
ncbi:hypothetical protein RvY_12743 [Ramazzottius varieornatus]|uniref:Uncharacterized protein n=1 Tax=Ramazzottius varieornatus TaxID=947166 RepID=A0A1D1VKJ2_RAMVA|nr:hypothetical protein RvY_12743 [Ramazzottius varieornatus]